MQHRSFKIDSCGIEKLELVQWTAPFDAGNFGHTEDSLLSGLCGDDCDLGKNSYGKKIFFPCEGEYKSGTEWAV